MATLHVHFGQINSRPSRTNLTLVILNGAQAQRGPLPLRAPFAPRIPLRPAIPNPACPEAAAEGPAVACPRFVRVRNLFLSLNLPAVAETPASEGASK
jgi:hypothetical protein